MKRTRFALLATFAALVLAACTPPLPEMTELEVDGGPSEAVTLPDGKSAYFELSVGEDPVRVDAYPESGGYGTSIDLVVYNTDRVPIAVADSRRYFHAPFQERLKELSVEVTPYWSVNLPAGAGTVYLEVKNWGGTTAVFRVEAVTRGGPEPADCTDPSTFPELTGSVQGAILYLGQTDCYSYQGAGDTVRLVYDGPLALRLKVVSEDGYQEIEPGEEASGLKAGDLIYVYDYTNRQVGAAAGFCNADPGDSPLMDDCQDGVSTGEYWIEF